MHNVPVQAVLTQRRFAASSVGPSFRFPRDLAFAIGLGECSPDLVGSILSAAGCDQERCNHRGVLAGGLG
jgi:hypothetical protein